ncbi:MAG: hypothetical protein V2J24_16750 [Pseudomonadales bacterium]|jgi:hypothetical protein|nr:hypothetical protein [Pseudomonadales bacterium]
MDAIDTVRDQLVPLADELVEQLEADGDPDSARWFSALRASLAAAREEEDLIMIFIEQLGPTGPMAMSAGFSFAARFKLDVLLERAQEVAFAFSADGDAH